MVKTKCTTTDSSLPGDAWQTFPHAPSSCNFRNKKNQFIMSYTPHASYIRIANEAEFVCYNTCQKLVKNLLKNDDKYKTIKLTNPKINERICQVNNGAAVDYLIKIGFVKDLTNNVLNFTGTTEHIQQEANMLDAICSKFKTSQENIGPATTKKNIDVTLLAKRSSQSPNSRPTRGKNERETQGRRERRKQLLKNFEMDKKARAQPGWEAKVSAARAKGGVEIHKGSTRWCGTINSAGGNNNLVIMVLLLCDI